MSGNRSSLLRKRALCRLSHEQRAAYAAHYEQVLAEIPGLTRYQARPRAWTRLRHEFPGRYLELFALERGGIGVDVPPAANPGSVPAPGWPNCASPPTWLASQNSAPRA